MFLGAVSGGLVALGLISTASNVGAAFYAFGLILLPTLAFVGAGDLRPGAAVGIEDFGYAQRIARLRGYCFQYAPELVGYLLSVPPTERLRVQGMHGGLAAIPDRGRMVGVVTAVLAGSAAWLLAAVAALAWLMRHQRSAWTQVRAARHSPTTEGQLIRCS